uniref:Protein kinase domain-containing protein n=1 Tax=Ganoderma boninense TaxID=34458 RepID=A0A5K1JU60_9APHY|nr:Uncharacterized protein [Ganoderma boninense]
MPSSLGVPDWLKGHPDLRARDISLVQGIEASQSFPPRHPSQRLLIAVTVQNGNVFCTGRPYKSTVPQYVVKVLHPHTEECSINQRVQAHPSSANHGLPSEIIPSEPRLLLMPFVDNLGGLEYRNRPASFFVDIFHQLIEGVEYLHQLQIAHLDICFGNVAYGTPNYTATDARLVEGRVYLIDFGQSRQLALGPGLQPPIVLPQSQEKKPPGVTALDPYAFDVYCTGKLMQFILRVGARDTRLPSRRIADVHIHRPRSSRSARGRLPLGSFGGMRSGWWAPSAGARPCVAVVRLPVEHGRC